MPGPQDPAGPRPSCRREWLWTGALLLCFALVGYGQLLRPGYVPYSRHSDNIAQNIAGKQLLYRSLQEGKGLPLWRNDQLVGWPAMTQPQALYTYPLHGLFWWLPPASAIGWTFWLHILAVGWVFFALGRVLGVAWGGQLLMACGAMFQFKLILAMYAGWLPTLPGLVWAPALLVVVLSAIQRPRWSSGLWMALVGTLCLHCGHLQSFYYTVLSLVALLLVVAARWWREGRKSELWVLYGSLGGGALLAVGMSAYLLAPLLLEASLTTRVQASYASFLAGGGASFAGLKTLLYPEWLGTPLDGSYAPVELWEHAAYFGLIPLALALLGLFAGIKRRFVPFLACGWLVFLFVLPFDTPLLGWLHGTVPGFSLFRSPMRMYFIATYFGLGLAGWGWQRLSEMLAPRPRRIALGFLLFAMVLEGSLYSRRYLKMKPIPEVMPTTAYQKALSKKPGHFRIAALGRPTLNPGWAAPMGLQIIHGYEPYNYRHYQLYFGLLQRGRWVQRRGAVWADLRGIARFDLLDMLGVRYLLSPYELRTPPQSPLVHEASWPRQPHFLLYGGLRHKSLHLYRNKGALPRAFWAQKLRCTPTEGQMKKAMLRPLRREAIVLAPASVCRKELPVTRPKDPALQRADSGVYRFSTSHGGFLILGDVWHPGWKARNPRGPLPVYRVNMALLGLWIPKGSQEITVAFEPLGWPWALWIGGVALGLFLLSLGGYLASTRAGGSHGPHTPPPDAPPET